MPNSSTTASSDRASRYLQQLCKHFAHKVPVEFTTETGQIIFSFNTCTPHAARRTPHAEGASLTLVATGETDDIDRLEQVIGDHLARFAFRENITLTWQWTV